MAEQVPPAVVAAAALHAGFQLAVSTLVYPALAAEAPERFARAHDAHSRRITPLVGIVYAAVLASSAPVLAAAARGRRPAASTLVSIAAQLVSLATTALVAAPLHRRLGRTRTEADLRRLRRADLVRTGASLVALAAVVRSRG